MSFKLKSQSPIKQVTPPGKVKYGTPEYKSAYNKGEVLSKDGTRSPIALDEVTIKAKPKKDGFWKQSINKYTKEHAGDGLFEALGSVVTYPLQVPQDAATYATTGKVQRPSEALNIKNKVGAAVTDMALDPVNLVGGGSVVKGAVKAGISKLSKKALAPVVEKSVKTIAEPVGIKSINKILESVDGKNYASKYKSVKKAPNTQGASSSTLDNIMNFSKTGKEPQKKIVGYLDDASEEPTLYSKFAEKWKNDVEKSFNKIGEETGKHLKEFEATHGASYSERDVNLFARLKGTDAGKRDPLVSNVIKEQSDKFKYAEEFGYTKSGEKNKRKVDNAFATKHGIDKSGFTKTDELLNNVYSQGYDSKINGRTAHIDGVVNKKFYKKDIVPRLENLVTKNKLKSEETLYRGDKDYAVKKVWRNGEKLPKGSVAFSDLQKGDVWKPGSFVSTSIDKNVASGFGKIRSEIKAPAGQSTLYSNSVKGGQFTSEKEALLPSKLKFKVEGKTGTGGNINFKHSIVNPYTVTGVIGGSMMFSGNKKK